MPSVEETPQLSVVMSVYNGESYLAEAVESILGQSYRDFEFVIINDGSKDGSTEILRRFAQADSRIRLIEQENTGLTKALLRGVAEAKGEFVARMDADDLSCPDRFERQVALLGANPGLVAATCHFEHFRDDGSVVAVSRGLTPMALVPLFNCFGNRIGGHGQVMFRRTAYDLAGGYDPSFRYAQDYDLWARLTDHGEFGMVEDVLYRYRTGHDCITTTNRSGQNDSALRTGRREYRKLTGVELDEDTAQALQDFWGARDLSQLSLARLVSISKAMSRALRCFFQRHPRLAGLEPAARRVIADRWSLYRERARGQSAGRGLIFAAFRRFWS